MYVVVVVVVVGFVRSAICAEPAGVFALAFRKARDPRCSEEGVHSDCFPGMVACNVMMWSTTRNDHAFTDATHVSVHASNPSNGVVLD